MRESGGSYPPALTISRLHSLTAKPAPHKRSDARSNRAASTSRESSRSSAGPEHSVPDREAGCSNHPATAKRHDPEKACPAREAGCAAVFGNDHAQIRKVALGGGQLVPKTRPTATLRVRLLHLPPIDAGEAAFDSPVRDRHQGSATKDGWCRRGAVNAVPLRQEVRFRPLPTNADVARRSSFGAPLRRPGFDYRRPHQFA